jgi:hypothetical protein
LATESSAPRTSVNLNGWYWALSFILLRSGFLKGPIKNTPGRCLAKYDTVTLKHWYGDGLQRVYRQRIVNYSLFGMGMQSVDAERVERLEPSPL